MYIALLMVRECFYRLLWMGRHSLSHTHIQTDNKSRLRRRPPLRYSQITFNMWFLREFITIADGRFCTTINTLPLRWWTVHFLNPLRSRQILRTHRSKSVSVGLAVRSIKRAVKWGEFCLTPHPQQGGFPVRWVIYFVSYPQSTQTKAFFFKMRSEGRVFTGVFWR